MVDICCQMTFRKCYVNFQNQCLSHCIIIALLFLKIFANLKGGIASCYFIVLFIASKVDVFSKICLLTILLL